MTNTLPRALTSGVLLSSALFLTLPPVPAAAQNPELQQKLAAIKESSAKNKQALAHYTWRETDTISLKGEDKKVSNFQVQLGPDGKPQKTPLDQPQAQQSQQQDSSGRRGGRLKEKVVEKKKAEYKDYGQDMAALAQSYASADPQKLQAAYQAGNIKAGPTGAPNEIQLIITSFVKPNDSVTLLFNKELKAIQSLQIDSYLDDPKDAVKINVQFAKLPDGTNHVSTTTIDGVSKQLTVAIQNSNYQKL
jgi:hypothetical protein